MKYLSLGDKAVITTVGNMGDVVDESTYKGHGGITGIQAKIVTVLKGGDIYRLQNCNNKVTQV